MATNTLKPLVRLPASVKLTSNGDGAKTVKVQITARSGDVINNPYWGPMVHDFAGMTSKARIPLDYNHDPEDSIGYLNKFDTSSGDLICSGVIVLVDGTDEDEDDNVTGLVAKMQAGVPYEASIEFDDDFTLQFVPEGSTVNVNGRDIAGPVTVFTQWTLKAVAICKFGCDSDTSSELLMSKNRTAKEGFTVRFGKQNNMTKDNTIVPAVEAPAKAAEEVAVEAVVKAEEGQKLSQAEATPVAVEAIVTEEAKPVAVEAVPEVAVEATKLAKTVDPREDFKRYLSAFGAEKAAMYFSEGKSFDEAMATHCVYQQSQIIELSKRLATIDRGADKPLKMSVAPVEEAKRASGLGSLINVPNKK